MGRALHTLSHRSAVALMVLVTLLWSMAGIVTRQVEHAQGLELTFWRSAFNALALFLFLAWRARGIPALWQSIRHGGSLLWGSGACWAVMFTAFMAALTMTTVANVLLTMALAPLFTAVLARVLLSETLPRRTLWAIALAVVGMAWMQAPLIWPAEAAGDMTTAEGAMHRSHLLGILVSLAVPVGGALNWVLIRRSRMGAGSGPAADLLPAVLIGALLSAVLTVAWAVPGRASTQDLAWLALLGVFQLALPCLLAVRVAQQLTPTEVSLLSLLELVFGVAWAWLGTSESPTAAVLTGGALVLGALVLNEAWAKAEG